MVVALCPSLLYMEAFRIALPLPFPAPKRMAGLSTELCLYGQVMWYSGQEQKLGREVRTRQCH